jgi:hypothetical protein
MSAEAYDWLVDALFDVQYREILIRASMPGGALFTLLGPDYEASRCGQLEKYGFAEGSWIGKNDKGQPIRRLKLTDLAKPVFL